MLGMFYSVFELSLQDLSRIAVDGNFVTKVPLDAIVISTPDDGLPAIEDWITVVVSFVFQGSRLHREPLDLNIDETTQPSDGAYAPMLSVKKGFTRLCLGEAASKLLRSGLLG